MKNSHLNIGPLDQSIRIVLALTAFAIYRIKIVNRRTNWILIFIALVFLLTAVLRYCLIYRFWEFSTNEEKENY